MNRRRRREPSTSAHYGGRLRVRCKACVVAKGRCSSGWPCSRCFDRCLRCEPASAEGDSSIGPFIDLALTAINPRYFASAYLQAFHALHSRGDVCRDSYVQLVRCWRALSARLKTDVTHGVSDEVCRTLGISQAEVQPHAHADDRKELYKRLKSSGAFHLLDDGVSAVVVGVASGSGPIFSGNPASADVTCTGEELEDHLSTHGVLPDFVLASLVAPEDRGSFFTASILGLCGARAQSSSSFVKMSTRDGAIDLRVLKFRRVSCAEFPGELCGVMTIEKVPLSRHVTRRPGHRHRYLDVFRRRGLAEPASGETRTSEGAGGSPSQPAAVSCPALRGLVCLPVPPVEDLDQYASSPMTAVLFPPPQLQPRLSDWYSSDRRPEDAPSAGPPAGSDEFSSEEEDPELQRLNTLPPYITSPYRTSSVGAEPIGSASASAPMSAPSDVYLGGGAWTLAPVEIQSPSPPISLPSPTSWMQAEKWAPPMPPAVGPTSAHPQNPSRPSDMGVPFLDDDVMQAFHENAEPPPVMTQASGSSLASSSASEGLDAWAPPLPLQRPAVELVRYTHPYATLDPLPHQPSGMPLLAVPAPFPASAFPSGPTASPPQLPSLSAAGSYTTTTISSGAGGGSTFRITSSCGGPTPAVGYGSPVLGPTITTSTTTAAGHGPPRWHAAHATSFTIPKHAWQIPASSTSIPTTTTTAPPTQSAQYTTAYADDPWASAGRPDQPPTDRRGL